MLFLSLWLMLLHWRWPECSKKAIETILTQKTGPAFGGSKGSHLVHLSFSFQWKTPMTTNRVAIFFWDKLIWENPAESDERDKKFWISFFLDPRHIGPHHVTLRSHSIEKVAKREKGEIEGGQNEQPRNKVICHWMGSRTAQNSSRKLKLYFFWLLQKSFGTRCKKLVHFSCSCSASYIVADVNRCNFSRASLLTNNGRGRRQTALCAHSLTHLPPALGIGSIYHN